jgi:hypothetical protein
MKTDLYQRVALLYKDYTPQEIAEAHRQLRAELNLNEAIVEKKRKIAILEQELDAVQNNQKT